MAYNEIDPDDIKIWDPKKQGEELLGTYTKLQENAGKYKSNLYRIKTEKGERYAVFGSTILDDKMSGVKPNSKIKIVFDGIGEGKDNDFKKFKVFVDDGSVN